MAKILIDTQILIWLLANDQNLGKQARKLLENTANEVAVSYFSLLEITLKAAIGKITYDDMIYSDLAAMQIRLLPANRKALAGYRIFNTSNKDPFDNLLLSVAKAENYQLMTVDQPILQTKVGGLKVLDARQ